MTERHVVQEQMLDEGLGESNACIENTMSHSIGELYNFCCLCCSPCGCGSFKEVYAGNEGLVLRFGVLNRKVPPGRHRINCLTEEVKEVFLRTAQFDLPPMSVITKDTLTCVVDAICRYTVLDSEKAALVVTVFFFLGLNCIWAKSRKKFVKI